MRRRLGMVAVVAAGLGLAGLLGGGGQRALGALTGHWRSTTYKDFDEGEPHGVMIGSRGEVVAGLGATRYDAGVSVVWSSATGADGTAYLGTGDEGKVLVAPKGQPPTLLAALPGTVMVTALAWGPRGQLFAATLPEGRIFVLDPSKRPTGAGNGEAPARELVRLPNVEHVWALAWDEAARRLWVATGPGGQLFAVDEAGEATVVLDLDDEHLMSLLLEKEALWVGTSDEALLLRVPLPLKGPKATASVVQDFEGDEVRAIVRGAGGLFVAVNDFDKAKAGPISAPPPRPQRGTRAVPPDPTKAPAATSTGIPGTLPPPSRPFERRGRGAVFFLETRGAEVRVEPVHALVDGYFAALAVDAQGNVLAGSAPAGKVFQFAGGAAARSVLTAVDVPERQVLSLDLSPRGGLFTTGDSGALYRFDPGLPKEAHYLSRVFDAEHPSRFGRLRWLGEGAIAIETRSGNTSKPDASWSPWAPLTAVPQSPRPGERVGVTASPAGRYFQWKARFGASTSTLRELSTYFSPQNQRAKLVEVAAEGGGAAASPPGAVGTVAGAPALGASAQRSRTPTVKLRWRAENPDRDELVYRVWFREEAGATWRPIADTDREPTARTELEWGTDAIPDGLYVVKVECSDERSNPRDRAMHHELVSTPFLVDNRRPDVSDLRVVQQPPTKAADPATRRGAQGALSLGLSGVATDGFSPITELSYSVDGGEYRLLAAADGVLDDLVERFSATVTERLTPGTHVVAIRAVDSAGNVGAAQTTVQLR